MLFLLKGRTNFYGGLLLVVFAVSGFVRASAHTKYVAAPILPEYRKSYEVGGWVERVDQSGSLQNFYIRVHSFKGFSVDKAPVRVRIRMKPRGFKPGDAIQIRALLTGPPGPAIVGGYDTARAAYFKRIGGYGFAISRATEIDLGPLPMSEKFSRQLVTLRYKLSRRIQARAPPRTAGLQAALLTGDRSAIPPAQSQSLRAAGLAHLLAISGLHMGLLAGGAYYFASLMFSMIGPLARHYDMRKGAAVIGALFACAYLLLSGASVSTQRAFIMAIVIFAAVILNRRAVSLRSVALAAALTLMLHPESLMSAGFQMSFSATAALVVVFRYWSSRRIYKGPGGVLTRLWAWFGGISLTSLVAGLATGGFAALQFHRFARYGFFANLAAMPVFTLVAMPAGFFAVLMMPLGLDVLPLKVMGLGLDVVLFVSDWTSSRDGALAHLKGANGLVISVFGMGFVFLCLGPARIRLAGGLLLACSLFLWSDIKQPDIRISQQARIAFWDPDEVKVLRVDRVRGDKFGRARFVEAAGLEAADLRSYLDTSALCDLLACNIDLKGVQISIVHEPEGVMEACSEAQLVILTLRRAGPRARRLCKAILLDAYDLKQTGARDINITKQGIKVRRANSKRRNTRPWGR